MLKLVEFLKVPAESLHRDDRASILIEYGLLIALIVVIVVPALIALGPVVAALYTGVIGV
jgi:pilus assembly protein Flp/PilA